jgi:prepilin-type N-terminal cleavage/methylation domain-containing protein
METEANRGLGYGGVPFGTSSKNKPKGNEGIRLKANRDEGFTLVELLIVTLLLAIFLTLASVNWQVFSRKGGESFLESFSIEVILLREEAISNYEERAIQFDISTNSIYIGRPDRLKGFLQARELKVPEPYVLRDVVLNGEKISVGKPTMRFLSSGMIDRVILHFVSAKDQFYTVLLNPLTARVTGENGYVEEIALR